MLLPVENSWGEQPSVDMQIRSLAHLANANRRGAADEVLRSAAWGLRTLEFVAANQDFIRVMLKLRRNSPTSFLALTNLFETFPEIGDGTVAVRTQNEPAA